MAHAQIEHFFIPHTPYRIDGDYVTSFFCPNMLHD